jgi:hypothetical protein
MAQVRDSINDALEEVSMVTGSRRRILRLTMFQNRNFYRIPMSQGHYAWPVSIWLMGTGWQLDQTDFIWLNDYNPRWLQNVGKPERYVPVGVDTICVHPAPSSDTGILEIDAVVIPERYTTDTDRIKLRDAWKWATVHYATGEYWASRGDAKTALYHHGKYLEQLGLRKMMPESDERIWTYKTKKRDQPSNHTGA